ITIVNIGTKHGSSSLALSYNIKNKIISFDICDAVTNIKIKTRSNITFQIDNIFESLDKYKDLLLSSSIIFIDTDPHQGIAELKLYNYLKHHNYDGLLIYDDIWHFEAMRNNFWYKIEDEYKFDLTPWGHWSGTG